MVHGELHFYFRIVTFAVHASTEASIFLHLSDLKRSQRAFHRDASWISSEYLQELSIFGLLSSCHALAFAPFTIFDLWIQNQLRFQWRVIQAGS